MGKYFSKPTTYARLNDVLLSLGYRRYISPSYYNEKLEYTLPDAVVYEHDKAGAIIMLPVLPLDTKLNWGHQSMAASNAHGFGLVRSREAFNAMIAAPAERAAPQPERELAEAAA